MLTLLISIAEARVTRSVRAIGIATITDGDQPDALDRARRLALRDAVERGVGVLVSSASQVSNFQLLEDHIFVATRGYVHSYEVVEQGVTDDGLSCRVVLDARVDLEEIERELAAMDLALVIAGSPRLRVRVRESVVDLGGSAQDVEWGIVRELLLTQLRSLSSQLDVTLEGGIDGNEADLIVDVGAQVIANDPKIPQANQRLSASGLHSMRATIRVEILWIDNDRPVAIVEGVGAGAGTTLRDAGEIALRWAAESLAEPLRKELAEEVRRRAYVQRPVRLTLTGHSGTIRNVGERLHQQLRGVDRIAPRQIDEDLAVFDLNTQLGAFDIARQVSARGLGDFDVEILQVTANTLKLELADGKAGAAP
ncbi:MAG: hypothetical protein VX733_00135 [Candidatus Latescibacterota bacterium]|nr:hypothetical protein [Candidatus Latescibacterota bacterium]